MNLTLKHFVLFKVETVIVKGARRGGIFIYLLGVEVFQLPLVRRPRLCDCDSICSC